MSTMKLSEAIKAGAMLRPQAIGVFFVRDVESGAYKSCSLAAAYEALNPDNAVKADTDDIDAFIGRQWPFTETTEARCPAENCLYIEGWKGDSTYMIVTHLNDVHKWTREAVAEWVATVEPSTPEAPDSRHPSSASTENATAITPE